MFDQVDVSRGRRYQCKDQKYLRCRVKSSVTIYSSLTNELEFLFSAQILSELRIHTSRTWTWTSWWARLRSLAITTFTTLRVSCLRSLSLKELLRKLSVDGC